MLNHRDLLRAHVGALFTLNGAGRLLRVNEPNGQAAPRFFLGRTSDGSMAWFRDDLPAGTVGRLEAVCAGLPDVGDAGAAIPDGPFREILSAHAAVTSTWSGPAFHFPEAPSASPAVHITSGTAHLLRPFLVSWHEDVEKGQPLWAVVVDGRAVSICGSVRQTAIAHEAGVETVPEFRGRGYAGQAVNAWAAAVRQINREPLYSTSWSNVASRAVARRLGLVQFAGDLHIT